MGGVGILLCIAIAVVVAVFAHGYLKDRSGTTWHVMGRVRADEPMRDRSYEIEVGLERPRTGPGKVTFRRSIGIQQRWSRSSASLTFDLSPEEAQALGRHFIEAAAIARRDAA